MKNRGATRSSPVVAGVVLLAIALTGCAGSQSPNEPTLVTATDAGATRAAPTAGGAFSGAYSGSYTLNCPISTGYFFFNGSGTASFIHASGEKGELKITTCADQNDGWTGTATLASHRHPSNTIAVSISGPHGAGDLQFPCFDPVCSFSVTGGTGKFKNATGSGMLMMTPGKGSVYSDTWSGTVKY